MLKLVVTMKNLMDLKNYYFPTNEIYNLWSKHYQSLINHIGANNLHVNPKLDSDNRVLKQEIIQSKIQEYVETDKNYDDFINAYRFNNLVYFSEILLQSLIAFDVLIKNDLKYDIFLSKDSILYFNNDLPPNIKLYLTDKKMNVLETCNLFNNIYEITKLIK